MFRGKLIDSFERPERVDTFLAALNEGGHRVERPGAVALEVLGRVHTAEYLDFLRNAHAEWLKLPGASAEVTPNTHPGRHMARRPKHIVGLAGYHMADAACPIGAGTWEAILASAASAVAAAEAVRGGESAAYALCRPPGHHAFADMAGGFCYVNNAALAAEALRRRYDRVAVLDIDVHHGNGTQGIFWRRADVFFVSLHADPANFYPFFAGHADETGEGPGAGFNLNLPLAHGGGDDVYLAALDRALQRIRAYSPGALVISLGLDASEADPLGALKVTTAGFGRTAVAVASLGLPTALIQEGGYPSPVLGPNLQAYLGSFER
jgi:acetoin utilization deacetylase AcuC-like enzyme